MKKIYISGKITGLTNWAEKFNAVEWFLTDKDTAIYNPAKFETEVRAKVEEPAHSDFMRYDLVKMLECDEVVLLPDWRTSKGARAEKEVAEICGIPTNEIGMPALHRIIIEYRQKVTQK